MTIRVFKFNAVELGPTRTAELPDGWTAVGGEYRDDGSLWLIAESAPRSNVLPFPPQTETRGAR